MVTNGPNKVQLSSVYLSKTFSYTQDSSWLYLYLHQHMTGRKTGVVMKMPSYLWHHIRVAIVARLYMIKPGYLWQCTT